MPLILQNPEELGSDYLLKTLLEACEKAVSGGGAFAWATSAGARLLLEDETFSDFAQSGAFDLVVGVDAITNASALNTLADANERLTGLTARIFLQATASPLFHPKFCWFRNAEGGTLIVGSGNLTIGGLRGNWEAFSITSISESEIAQIESQWNSWTLKHASSLLPPTDRDVIARAGENTGWETSADRTSSGRTASTSQGVRAGLRPRSSLPVLVAEIPRAGDRWKQANFDLENYEGFFGAKQGTQRRILLQHVKPDGTREDVESRPSVEVKSQNYRFELEAAAGKPYPTTGRPIGVFVRSPTGVILYRLLMPSDSHHSEVSRFLDRHWTGRTDRMRRVRADENTLRAAWPDSPLWSALES